MATFEVTVKVDLPESLGEFQEVEAKIKAARDQAGRELMGKVMEAYEKKIFCSKGIKRKDRRHKTYQTTLGKIPYKRWRAKTSQGNTSYPVDDWIGLESRQSVSGALQEEIITQCVTKPYGKASQDVEKITGVKRSPVANWKLIQAIAQQRLAEAPEVIDYSTEPLPELIPGVEDPCPIIAIDPDATYFRPRFKGDKRHEVKVAILYTAKGPIAKSKGKLRWQLKKKQVVFSNINEEAHSFFRRVVDKCVTDYGLHAQTRVICHGDGDSWIKQLRNNFIPQTLNRLDPYHAFKKMREAGLDPIPQDLVSNFYRDPKALIKDLKQLELEFAEVEDKEKMRGLIGYFTNNLEGMLPSGVPKEIKEENPRMYLRGSGTIESNIDWSIGARFKRPRMNWSEQGSRNLSHLREEYLNKSTDFKKIRRNENIYRKPWAYEVREMLRETR